MNGIYLSNLKTIDPPNECPHALAEKFLIEMHGAAGDDLPIAKLIARYGVRPEQIATRKVECADYLKPAGERELYEVGEKSATIADRTRFFARRAEEIVERFFVEETEPPAHLIHVTCTGYAAPSAIQQLVAKRGWSTTCTNAYHMGCFAALPAIRIGVGQVAAFGGRAEVVHTEMCTLHMNPAAHTPEQIVVQTLFADGHANYRVSREAEGERFKIRALRERVLPDSAALMTWMPAPWGLEMTLSREVPKRITSELLAFTEDLLAQAGLNFADVRRGGLFAVHPGGPKIIDAVVETLNLDDSKVRASREILRARGNMSSATLPHIWKKILDDVPPEKTIVVSLAFGPGLTLFGAVFEVER